MRPAQQNRRMRGRGNNNNNNRKGPNPLSRNYESNGPDVKIRGNAQHIAEKYTTLARDAQASGDRVMAENYLQHAEHYNRIILAAMAQNPVPIQREESFDDNGMDDDDMGFAPVVQQPVNGSGPQPVIEGTPAEVVYGEESGEQVKSQDNRQPREGREYRDQRRMARGRRPQRERFNAQDRNEDGAQDGSVQASEDASPRFEPRSEAPVAVEVTPVEAQPVEVRADEPKPSRASVVEAPVDAAPEEAEAPRRATRRPGRPRKVVSTAAEAAPSAEPASSDN